MSINSELKKENILNIESLSRLEINKIARTVSNKLCNTFPNQGLSQSNLFISLARINMYKADMPFETSSAKFFYKNNSIYFKKNINFDEIDTLSIHECIHYIQAVKDSNNKLLKMGLYNPRSFLDSGLALNEAAVQTIASLCNDESSHEVRYYDMDFYTISQDYYPLECSLLGLVLFFTGTYPLIHSTLYSDDVFKNAFISKSNVETYYAFQNNLDLILDAENELSMLAYMLQNTDNTKIKAIKKINVKSKKIRNRIVELTNATQNLIIKNCFLHELNYVYTIEDAKILQERLYDFKSLLIHNESADFYNSFYCDIMSKLDEKRSKIELNQIKDVSGLTKELVETQNKSVDIKKLENIILKLKILFKLKITNENLSKNS